MADTTRPFHWGRENPNYTGPTRAAAGTVSATPPRADFDPEDTTAGILPEVTEATAVTSDGFPDVAAVIGRGPGGELGGYVTVPADSPVWDHVNEHGYLVDDPDAFDRGDWAVPTYGPPVQAGDALGFETGHREA